jgi:uncharacterized protein (UPF0548 family)
MIRLLLLLALLPTVRAEDIPAAPAIEFRELVWWSQTRHGEWTWWPGRDGSLRPASLGSIREARILGPQELVWQNRIHPIRSVTTLADGTVVVGFDLGTLALRQVQGRRWVVTVDVVSDTVVNGTFQTFGSLAGIPLH